MTGALTPRQRAALRAAASEGLTRGKSAFYAGFGTGGQRHPIASVAGLVQRGLLARPDRLSARRVLTDAGRAALDALDSAPALPAVAPPRSYID